MLLGLALDAAIPDPTGIIIGARIAWSVAKTTYKLRENSVSKAECLQARMDLTRNDALAALEPGPVST